ncbi:hypothetical protein D3C87_2150350 [compost metagenome]
MSVAHGVAHQVLQRPVQITWLGFHPGAVAIGGRQAQAALHRDVGAQRCQFFDHLIDQRIQIDALKIQCR